MNNNLTLEQQITQVQATFISKVYGWMSCALVVTGIVAIWAATTPAVLEFIFPASGSMMTFYLLIAAEFGAVIYLTARIDKMSAETAGNCISSIFGFERFDFVCRVFDVYKFFHSFYLFSDGSYFWSDECLRIYD